MTNRLKALREKTPGVVGDAPPPVSPELKDPLKEFWDEYERVSRKVDDIDDILHEIGELDDEIQRTQNQKEAVDMRAELHTKLSKITTSCAVIRKEINSLKETVDDAADENPGSADIRVQLNHLHVLSNKFTTTINKFTTMQDEIKAKFAKQVTRHYAIAGINIDEIEAQRIITENPDALQQSVFTLQGNSAQMQEVVSTYNTIAARHDDILSIERTMQELLDQFVQFAILVKDQGRQIDNIESNISQATDYVEKATKHLEIAATHQKKSRKCLYIVLGSCVILLLVVVIVVVLVTKKK